MKVIQQQLPPWAEPHGDFFSFFCVIIFTIILTVDENKPNKKNSINSNIPLFYFFFVACWNCQFFFFFCTFSDCSDWSETALTTVDSYFWTHIFFSYFLNQMQQQELAQMRQRDANLTALAAIGPRKKRKVDSPGATPSGTEVRTKWKRKVLTIRRRNAVLWKEEFLLNSFWLVDFKMFRLW